MKMSVQLLFISLFTILIFFFNLTSLVQMVLAYSLFYIYNVYFYST